MILATSVFLVAALAKHTPAHTKAHTEDAVICESIDERAKCELHADICKLVVDEGFFFVDWACEEVDRQENEVETDVKTKTEVDTDVKEEDSVDPCNQYWDNKEACSAAKDLNCVHTASSWLYKAECNTESCDHHAFDEETCLASSVGCEYVAETLFYHPACNPKRGPECEILNGEFASPSTADCSCGNLDVPKGSLACYADEVSVKTCGDYMDVDDDACAESKYCKLADQGTFSSWFFVRECIPKDPEEIEVETDVEVDTEVDTDVKEEKAAAEKATKGRSSTARRSPKPSDEGKKEKNCGIFPCCVVEYKFYFIAALGALAALLVVFIALKCCRRRRAKE